MNPFGTYIIPEDPHATAQYICPYNLPPIVEVEIEEVTHEVFFGENIKRVIDAFFK